MTTRRGRNEHAIYFDQSKGRWFGAISLGYDGAGKRLRRKVSGRTKQEVKDEFKRVEAEIASGVRSSDTYTVGQCVSDWLESLDDGPTKDNYQHMAKHLQPLGPVLLRDLTARDVQNLLAKKALDLSTNTVKLIRHVLVTSIRQAEIDDLVMRNVAALTKIPAGRAGRPSKALTLAQATSLIARARSSWLWGYVAVSLLGGIRTEEARALLWSEVDLDAGTVSVYRSERVGSDTKTTKSRRTLKLPQVAAEALDGLPGTRVATDHVFTYINGQPLTAAQVRRQFDKITKAAGLGTNWTPRELRHTFVSILSDSGMAIETISDLVGHTSSQITETVYRHSISPVMQAGATAMDQIFEVGSLLGSLACRNPVAIRCVS
jgi:integrase